MSRVFYVPERPNRPAFSQKTRQGDQNASRFRRKHVRATKTPRVFAENTSGRPKRRRVVFLQRKSSRHPKRFSSLRHDFAEHPHGWCFPNAKAATTTAPHHHQGLATHPYKGASFHPYRGAALHPYKGEPFHPYKGAIRHPYKGGSPHPTQCYQKPKRVLRAAALSRAGREWGFGGERNPLRK